MATTNILQISGFAQIPYRIFILPPTSTKSTTAPSTFDNDLRRTQITLLRRGQLVNVGNGELWTFSRDGAQSAPVPDENTGLQEISTGTLFARQLLSLDESPPQGANTQNLRNGAAHEHFLSAVRALAEFQFLQLPGYSVLGKWLIPPSTDDFGDDDFRSLLPALSGPSTRREMFKLAVNLTATGDLYFTPECNVESTFLLLNATQPPEEGSLIFLSPSGQAAEFVSVLPSTPQISSVLQRIRSSTALDAKFPLVRVRLLSGVETLWPASLCFLKSTSKSSSVVADVDYFSLKDGISSAAKLIADALTYKPPPAPSPAIPPAITAQVTPSGAYHTPPDGIIRTKPIPIPPETPNLPITTQEDWIAPAKEEEFWPSVVNGRGDDEDFTFSNLEDGFDLREEDFNFFDDEPSGEFEADDAPTTDLPAPEEQVQNVSEETAQPMEDVKAENLPTPSPVIEPHLVLSPPTSPLRIILSPPLQPTRRGTVPKIWDHVRLSGDLEKIHDKYRRGGKYWCDELDEEAITDETLSSSSSDDEGMDWIATNPRKRKRDDDHDESRHRFGGSGNSGVQSLDPDFVTSMIRAIDENNLLVRGQSEDLFSAQVRANNKFVDYANGLDLNSFNALVEIVANQVSWDGLGFSKSAIATPDVRMNDLISVISTIWGENAPNNPGLKELTEVTDNIATFEEEEELPQQTSRMKVTKSQHSHPNSAFSMVSNIEQTQSIYPISAPPFLVHRIIGRNSPAPNYIQRLSVSPPALRFWEKFSMSPVAGDKDVQCYVVYPESDGMVTAVDVFLSEVQTAWEACGMGKFERGKVAEGARDGMISVSVQSGADEEVCLAGYQDSLVNFGRGLSKLSTTWLKNILILIVNPFAGGSAVIPLCRAFLSFKSLYFESVDNPALIPANNVALQILPVSMVGQKEGIVMRSANFHTFLRRLYDRCEVMENTTATTTKTVARGREFLTSPATMLASPPPTTLEFTDSFPAQHRSLLRDNSSLHVAYSISSDNRWVTAVWTDDWGQVSLKESFCLSRLSPSGGTVGKLQLMQSFDSVCAQVWRRTLEIAKQARINWKVVIVREGGMSKHEVGIWNTLKDNNPSELAGRIQLILACIDLHPPLSVSVLNSGLAAASPVATISTPFPSSVATFSQSSPAALGNAYGTPVATPLAQANESPDPSGGIMSTPGGTANSENVAEFDPDARWVDASDEVWGIVLNHRVPPCTRSDTEKETRFALASGYLWPMKSNDSHNLVQVHLLHVDKPQPVSSPPPDILPSAYARSVLKQLLAQYRGLSSLGVVRGTSLSDKIVPWHIVAAERIKDIFADYM